MKKNNFIKINFKKAFGLIELMLYVGILSGLMVVSSNVFISLSKGGGQAQARSEVNQAIRFSTERIKQDIKNSSAVLIPLSSESNTLSMSIGGNTVTYEVVSGVLKRTEGLGSAVPITGPNISVDEPVFSRIENTNTIFEITTTSIQVNMMFRYNSTNPDWAYSSQLQTTINMNADSSNSYVGDYTYSTFNIEASSGAGGSISSSGITSNAQAATKTYTMTPDLGYALNTLTVDGVLITPVSTYTFSNITANHTIAVTFSAIPTYALTITRSGTGIGTVTSTPTGIDCGSTCVYSFNENTSVVLSATYSGTFVSWTGCTSTSGTIPNQTCTINMTSAKGITATFAATAPSITTTTPTSIAQTTATGGGEVVSDGGASVTARGVVWSTSINPTTALSTKTSDGTGTGVFSSSVTSLTANTLYHIRAYATNSVGTSYGADTTFTTAATTPTVSTASPVASITQTTAIGGGTITTNGGAAISVSGLVWSTTSNPTTSSYLGITYDGFADNSPWTSNITSLTASTLYHVRAYATNNVGTSYGSDVSFTTASSSTAPSITTTTPTSIAQTTATGGGEVVSDGGASVTARGVVWSTSINPTTALSTKTSDGTGTGVFSSSVTSLTANTLYHIRAYATNSVGTSYGADTIFTTLIIPTVTTPTSASVATTTVTLGANVTSLGNPASISARGTCFGTSSAPTTNCVAASGTTTGVFTQSRTGLTAGTLYYYRGYATNTTGTAYSADGTFTTLAIPTVTTPTSASIATTTVTLGANVTSLGNPASISARGVCYSTTASPTTPCSTASGTTTGIYTTNITGLTPGTLYYYRGFATNTTGTAYSADGTFTTTAVSTSVTASPTTYSTTPSTNISFTYTPTTNTGSAECRLLDNVSAALTSYQASSPIVYASASTSGSFGYYVECRNSTYTTSTGTSALITVTVAAAVSSLVGTPTQYNSNGTTSASVAMPTGVTTNDIMFAHILHYYGTADVLNSIPSGWYPAGGTGRHRNGVYNQALYYKVAVAGETGPYVFGFSGTAKVGVTISAYRGNFNSANPIDAFSNTEYVTSDTSYQAASLTVANANSTVLMFPSVYNTTIRTFLEPTTQSGSWTEDYDHGNTAPDFSRAAYRKLITASGATGVITSVGSLSGTTIKHAFAVVLNSNMTAVPTLTTTSASGATETTASSGGNISSQGGASVTARGVVWSTSSGPTTALATKTSDGTGTGSFSSSITGLTGGTTYYVRAYATNTGGTAYGNEISFATSAPACGGHAFYNNYCWYRQTTVGQTCGTFCTGIGKTCVNSTQTCAQDNAALAAAGVTCSTTDLNNGYNTTAPGFQTGTNGCNPRTSAAWSCGTGAVTTSSCSSSRAYWNMLCSCSS